MIVFATAYDDATIPNHRMAVRVRTPDDVFLEEEEATREALHRILSSSDAALMAFSHGQDGFLMAQGGGEAALAHGDSLPEVLLGRPVFAHACNTARLLGRAASNAGSMWWGYLQKVSAPDDTPGIAEILCTLFQYVKASFARSPEHISVDQFFQGLRVRCDLAKDALDEIYETNPEAMLLEAYSLIVEMESKLVVWIPGEEKPYNPPLANENAPR